MGEVDGTPSGRVPTIDPATLTAAADSWPSVVRGFICAAGAVAIGWRNPDANGYALGVILAIASPSLARALLAPLVAFMLRR